jgi:hypothetical protein
VNGNVAKTKQKGSSEENSITEADPQEASAKDTGAEVLGKVRISR